MCVCVYVCSTCAFFGVYVITLEGVGTRGLPLNGKHFLPCLPIVDLTNIVKTVLLFLKYIHIYTFSGVYMLIQMKNMQWRTSPFFRVI